jgi:hypothetical protein
VLISFFFASYFPHKTPTKKVTKKLENLENPSLATFLQDLFSHLFLVSNRNSTTVQLQYSIRRFAQLLSPETILATRAFTLLTLVTNSSRIYLV